VIVFGHYGCEGVRAALQNQRLGLIDNWLQHIQDIREKHKEHIQTVTNNAKRAERLWS
jgi:carbonic anhydrase